MPKEIGPHLLGRKPSPPDARDYKMADQLDAYELVWYSAFFAWLLSLFVSAPTPPVPADAVVHACEIRLDQGNTGHCVGFSWANWGNTDPIVDGYDNEDGHDLYYECKIVDGEPGNEDGSYVRSGAKMMKLRERVASYFFAADVDEIRRWVREHGPVVMGTNWYTGMFWTGDDGFVRLTGDLEGGHAWEVIGDLPGEDAALCQNSWGEWGIDDTGRFKVKWSDMARLLNEDGEACAGDELPL